MKTTRIKLELAPAAVDCLSFQQRDALIEFLPHVETIFKEQESAVAFVFDGELTPSQFEDRFPAIQEFCLSLNRSLFRYIETRGGLTTIDGCFEY